MIEGKVLVALAGISSATSMVWAAVYCWKSWLNRTHVPQLQEGEQQRLERIERAVEAIAVEVERLGEGQRFTTRLLTEQAQAARAILNPAPGYRATVTPH